MLDGTIKKKIAFLALFLFLIIVSVFYFLQRRQSIQQKNLIQNTSYDSGKYDIAWPLSYIVGNPNAYFLRVVLQPEIYTGKIEYNGLVIRAWNYALFKNKSGKVVEIGIPRAWYSSDQNKIYFLGTLAPISMEPDFSDKYLVTMIEGINNSYQSSQSLVGIYFYPQDTEIDDEFINFYKYFEKVELPNSFISEGDTSNLPSGNKIGHFFPITQLVFDVQK